MRPTFSGIGRAEACIPSCAPGIDSTSEASIRGTRGHAEIASGIGGADPGDWSDVVSAVHGLIEDPTEAHTEIALAYDPEADEAIVLGDDIGRDYARHGAKPTDFCGTLDFATARLGATGTVIDFKLGTYCDPAQLDVGALALARAFDLRSVRVAFWFVRPGEPPRCDEWRTLGSLELDIVAERMRRLAERIDTGENRRVSGPHCVYCPSYVSCPATTEIALSLIRREETTELTPESAGRAWLALEQAETFLKRVRERLEMYASAYPIALEDGRTVCLRETQRESIDGDLAYAWIRERYGDEIADQVCPRSASKDRLRKAVGDYRGAIDALRSAGAITSKGTMGVRAGK